MSTAGGMEESMRSRKVPRGDLHLLEMPDHRAENLLSLEKIVAYHGCDFDVFLQQLLAALTNRKTPVIDVNLTVTHKSTLAISSDRSCPDKSNYDES